MVLLVEAGVASADVEDAGRRGSSPCMPAGAQDPAIGSRHHGELLAAPLHPALQASAALRTTCFEPITVCQACAWRCTMPLPACLRLAGAACVSQLQAAAHLQPPRLSSRTSSLMVTEGEALLLSAGVSRRRRSRGCRRCSRSRSRRLTNSLRTLPSEAMRSTCRGVGRHVSV